MKKKIFLHMGAHKTGTTTLQASLEENRDLLRACGLIYPAVEGKYAHNKWANMLAESTKKNRAVDIAVEWLNYLDDNQALLLSAEAIYRHINNTPDYLLSLKSIFKEAEIIPVLCLRNQGAYTDSLYREWVLNWQYPHGIYRFITEFYEWFNYNSFVSKISQLGKPILMSYRQIAGADLSSTFIGHLGYSTNLPPAQSNLRESAPEAYIYLKRLLNIKYPEITHKNIVNQTLKSFLPVHYPELKNPMPKLIWQGPIDRQLFERAFHWKNKQLCDEFDQLIDDFFPQPNYESGKDIDSDMQSVLRDAYHQLAEQLVEKIGF